LYRALALLIIACPCALVISTPVTVVSALSGLARRGVLVKGGAILDLLARIRVFALDKTGTLTIGQPTVLQTRTAACQPDHDPCEACDELLLLAAAVETRSEHPLAQAVLSEMHARNLVHRIPTSSVVTSLAGRAIRGTVNGTRVTVGSHAFSHEHFSEHEALHEEIAQAEAQGQTVMLVSQDQSVIGFIGVADLLRQTSQEALQALKAVNPHYRIVMMTGDNLAAARRIAAGVDGLDEVRAGLMPKDKLDVVKSLIAEYGPVAMVGDGVNDAPALAAATVGIAMGGAGTAQAMDTADVVLMQDDLTRLPDLVRTSRRSHNVIWQNILFSLGIKLVFLILALPGWTTLWMAVFADMGASLLVTLNGMRVLSEKQ
jgi:Cd2+/Zn2+-exporting ATPase